jgi:hypothetical protein
MKFHELTGWYAKFEGEQTDSHGDIQLSPSPIDHVPGRSPAHEAARKRGDASRRVKRPRSKSEARRIAVQENE